MPTHHWELTGIPYTSARQPGGIAEAIGILRAHGLAESLGRLGVHDAGDLALRGPSGDRGPSGLLNEEALGHLVAAVRERVQEALGRERMPLLVGGDCPVVLGALAGLRDAGEDPGLIMVDGHEDAWPPRSSPTGEASDSEIAIALGLVEDSPPPLDRLVPLVAPSALGFLGPRDAQEIEQAGLTSLAPRVAYFADGGALRSGGEIAAKHTGEALEAVDAGAFWLHIDLDVLSSKACPAVDYPQPGGIDWADLERLVARAVGDQRCRGASVVIYNPDLDPSREVARAVVAFVTGLAGAASA